MTTIEYARGYLARGWSIIPLVPGTKRPATIKLADHLSGKSRLIADSLPYWFAPAAAEPFGIGIICGAPSGGLVVVDVDPRNGGDMESVSREVATDYAVATGGGGLHLYLTASGPVPKGKTGRPGVDRIGDGGYVVAPPTAVGAGYSVIRDGALGDLNAAPAWVLDRLAPHDPGFGTPGELWVADVLADPSTCAPGHQEETLTRLAWWAAGALDRDIADAILARWVEGLTLGNPREPWTSAHVRQKLDAAYAKREPTFVVQGTSSRAAPEAAQAKPCAAVEAAVGSPLASLEFPDQAWIVEDFVAPGAFTEVIGKVKKGKSTLVYQLIRAVVQGEEFLGRPAPAPSPVVLLTEQSGSSLRATVDRSGLARTDPVYVIQKPGVAALGSWPAAVAFATDVAVWLGARVLVVDTLSRLARLAGDAENSSGSVSVLDPFERARSLGIACVFVRHARKGATGEVDDIADAARGSSAITGDMDVVIRLRPHASEDVRVLSWESRLTDDPEDVTLRYTNGRYEVTDRPEPAAKVKRDARLDAMRDAIQKLGPKVTNADLMRLLGWSHHTVRDYRKRAESGENLPAPPAGDGRVKL